MKQMSESRIRQSLGRLWRPVVALAATAVVGAGSAQAAELTGAGATFPYPLYAKWFDVYAKSTGVRINYQSIGSGAGIKQLKNNTVDFGASDAALSNADMKGMPGQVVHIPTVAGAVALAYNLPGVGKGIRLDGATVADIFLGKVTRWNDRRIMALNPGKRLPNLAIAVAHRSDGSGTTNIFTSYLKVVSGSWAGRVGAGKSVNWPVGLGGKGNAGVAGIVKQTSGAIGYVELAYAVQNRLNYAAIRNRSGKYLLPSTAGVTAAANASIGAIKRDVRAPIVNASGANAYPISGFTYILVYKNQRNAAKKQALLRFLQWAIGAGQSYAKPLMYAPLPSSVVNIDRKALASIR